MRISLFLAVIFITLVSFSQERCGTIAPPPGELENWIQQIRLRTRIENSQQAVNQSNVITIPVVVHVLHRGEPIGTGTNLSDQRIIGQIDSLTADFRRLNADTVNTPLAFKPIAADVEINFVLARQDPLGKHTNGIVRINANGSFVPSRIRDLIEMRSLSHWPAENYFNIYCADLGTGLLGFATFPETTLGKNGSSDPDRLYLDGVYMDFQYFGNNPDAPAFESRGRTLTHEVGHFLGLRHIWGDGNCNVDDFINDTPVADTDNGGYSSPCTFPNPEDDEVCNEDEPEMFQNYMDYTDDICMNLFTLGQKECMRIIAENSPRRSTLMSSPGLVALPVVDNDLGVSKIIAPTFAACDPQITPIIEVTNFGVNEITNYEITLEVNGSPVFTSQQSVQLLPFEKDVLSFPNQIISGNSATIGFRITQVNDVPDENPSNDLYEQLLEHVTSVSLPFLQTFESGNEMLGQFGSESAWDQVLAPEVSPSNRALVFQSFNNNSVVGDLLKITTPPLDLNAVTTATLSFKYAYSGTPTDIYDGLIVRASSDCGLTYPDILFSEVGPNLQTAIPTANEFVPSSQLEWQEITINISDYQDTDGLRIQFEGLNGSNNIYLDDIRVEQNNILENDISLESIQGPLITCNENIDLELEVKNAGSEPITSFTVEGVINGESYSQTFSGLNIAFQEYQIVPINVQTLSQEENSIVLNVATVNGQNDESVISNTVEASININVDTDDFPLSVDFENENRWINTSPQNSSLWDTTLIGNNIALKASSFEEQTLGIQSWFVSPALSTGGLDSAGLSFRLSYANRQGFNDQFRVLLSEDCGKSFNKTLLEANSDSLAVTESSSSWVPTSDEDWKEFSLDLSQVVGVEDSIRIAFIMVNGNGNNLYIDDINIRGNEAPSYEDVIRVYPNPAISTFNLGFNLPRKESVEVTVLDMSGKLILREDVPNAFNQIIQYKTPDHPGLYFVRVVGANFVQTSRLFVDAN